MKMGYLIKTLRKKQHLTQTELGAKLSPPVSKAGIAKWESGKVSNIKRNYIEQMAKLFNISPYSLMCIDDNPLDRYTSDALEVAEMYMLLNDTNKLAVNNMIDALWSAQLKTDDEKRA